MSDKNDEREDEFTGPVNLGNPSEFTILEFGKKSSWQNWFHFTNYILPSSWQSNTKNQTSA